MHCRTTLALAVCLLVTFTSHAFGWGSKEHIQLARLAANRLIADPSTPPQMKAWLERNTPGPRDMAFEKDYLLHTRIGIIPHGVDGIPFWATMPDMDVFTSPQNSKVAPYGVHERLLHYIDLEFFVPDESKREYAHDLSGRPKASDIPHDMKDPRWIRAGMLPFRVEECYRKLIESIRAGKLEDKPGQYPRDEHAVKWAGYLAHYAADNTQPQHATIDYKSTQYFADKRNAPNVHSEVEWKMVDDEDNDYTTLREEYWNLLEAALNKVEDPIKTDDVFQATCEVSVASYEALPLIGLAAMKAAGQAGTPEKPQGAASRTFNTEAFFRFKGKFMGSDMTVAEMKAYQQAWAVKRIESLLRKAWDEAQKPQ